MYSLHSILSLFILSIISAGSLIVNICHAEFELNFTPVQNPTTLSDFPKGGYDNTGNAFSCPDALNPDCLNGTEASNDPTPFFYERVDGYWHLIIGDHTQGFAQETYTPIVGLFHSNSGGREPVFFTLNGNLEQWSGNGWDPLEFNHDTYGPENSSFSGNGTADPTKVIVRQVMGNGMLTSTASAVEEWVCLDGEFCQEYLKSQEEFKPLITQQYDDGTVSMQFSVDMRAIKYDDMSTVAPMINIISVNDPNIPVASPSLNVPSSRTFNMASDSQSSTVTAGQYTYTSGTGWHDDGDGDLFRAYGTGTYEYVDGISDFHLGVNWSTYYDPSQNPAGSSPGNEARCTDMTLAACTNPPVSF